MKIKFFLLLSLLTISSMAFAENGCPYGESPIGPRSEANPLGCIIDHQLTQSQAQGEQPPVPRGHWETRWGSIAVDGIKGRLGGVTNHKSKRAAEQAAIQECYSRGGAKDCKIYYTYFNQCAAVAWGDSKAVPGGRDTIEDASQDAMESCNKATPNCQVVYNACSKAQWISN